VMNSKMGVLKFTKSIHHSKVKNFSSEAITMKMQGNDIKIRELQGIRNVFGRLPYLATELQLDLSKVFSYPLTLVLMALADIDQ